MTTTPRVLRQGKTLEDTQTTQYTATNCKTIVDGCSIVNYGATPQTFSVNLVPSGGSAGSDNFIVKERSVAAGATDLIPELRGRRLDAGDFVSTDTSAGATMAFRMEGREFTRHLTMDDKQLAAVGVTVEHHFAPHLYSKRTFIPPGLALTQHAHDYDHASHVVRGVAVVIAVVDGKRRAQEYRAPASLIIPANTPHEVQNVGREVLEWYCCHITDETDPARVDGSLHP